MKRASVFLLSIVSCSRQAPVPANDAAIEAAPAISAIPSARPSVGSLLKKHAVTDSDFVRPVLYTWTTPQQIADLRASQKLLVATSYAGSGPSRFVLDLEDSIHAKGPGADVARTVLVHPALSRRRYAWPSPFATRIPLAGKSYGDALIRIVLKEDSLIARYHPEDKEPWSFVDMKGQPASFDPLRLGAVFHVRSSKTATAPFREYILCNEGQIASYEVGTPVIAAELKAEKTMLRALLPGIEHEPSLWQQAVAFENDAYRPTRANLEAILVALDAYDSTLPPFEKR